MESFCAHSIFSIDSINEIDFIIDFFNVIDFFLRNVTWSCVWTFDRPYILCFIILLDSWSVFENRNFVKKEQGRKEWKKKIDKPVFLS